MLTTEMSPIIAAAQAGDTIVVRHAGGRPTTYNVRSAGGKKARELKLEGRRGSMRVLVDGGDQIWIREASARAIDGSAHRRVMEIRNMTTAPNEKRAPGKPRSIGMILRDAAIREAGLPPGYDIELHPRGFQALCDSEPAGDVHASAYVAVCSAWKHLADRHADESAKARKLAAERWTCIVENERVEERLLRDLPPGYGIEPGDPGFFRAVFDDAGWAWTVRTSAAEAVVDAWMHAKGRLESDLSRHRTTAIDRDVAKADASRCRRALQQIREIAKGSEPTGKELKSGEMPEQVVAEVGHALRVESRDRGLGWRALGQLAAQPGLAWAAYAGLDKDPTP